MSETPYKNEAQRRKGRVYKAIIYGLSWGNEVRAQCPIGLWNHPDISYGWRSGPLAKSMSGIEDPDNSAITWTAWAFLDNVIFIQSSVMAPTAFINLRDIAADARANPADTPTEGL